MSLELKEKEAIQKLTELMPTLVDMKKVSEETGVSLGELKEAFAKNGEDFKSLKEAVDEIKTRNATEKKAAYLSEISNGNQDDEAKKDFFGFIKNVWMVKENPRTEYMDGIKEFQDKYNLKGHPGLETDTKDAMNTTDDGFSIPQAFSNQILSVADQASVAMAKASIIPIGRGNELPQINLDTDVTVAWKGENVDLGESEPESTQTRTKLKKLSAYSKFSNEYLEDEEVGIINWLITRFGMKMGQKIDLEVFQGDGTNFTGILNASGTNVVNMGTGELPANIAWDDFVDVEENLPTALYMDAPEYFMHKSVLSYVKKLKDSQNLPIWMPTSGAEPQTLNGYPIVRVDQMPTASTVAATEAFLAFGNLVNYGVGTKGGLSVMRDTLVTTDQSVLAVRRRLALSTLLPDAFVVLKAGAAS